jgi:hypothetical protein
MEDNVANFMELAAAVESAQKRMAEQYREVQAEYERAMYEATQRYQRSLEPGGGAAATDDDADAAASGEPTSFEEGADSVYKDLGTASS